MNIELAGMTDNHLRPCPECHGTRIRLKVRVAYGTYWHECVRCGYRAQMGKSIPEADAKWNEYAKTP